ncbi:MAG: histidine kinase [Haliscomenobacter sp.]|uniref:sensor histidine kinase n=1 Tax=Haliscomenobacter sp. TaxID=2717303 RepID=UPI0029BDC430|nr:histidine kinase [Haliscomenobacter sp.]MDX2069461.1 histidine kinase [Haliscomenobacter sp.]
MSQYRIILYHILAWLFFFSLPILSTWPSAAAGIRLPRPPEIFWMSSLLQLMLFYATTYWLMPYFYLKKQYLWFVLGVLVLLTLRGWVLFSIPKPEPIRVPLNMPRPTGTGIPIAPIFMVFPGFATVVLGAGFRLILEHRKVEQQQKERETESLRSELRFLRSQVSPHFLFNVLNSLTALARKKSDLLEPSLLKLSDLMRYALYETEQDLIPLESEIDYIENYIQLQELRFDEHMKLDIKIEREGLSHQQVAPMLLIPLVENAFKYGSQVVETPFISLHLYITTENHLVLQLKNACLASEKAVLQRVGREQATGLGLSNLRRRLALLYPDQHLLHSEQLPSEFSIYLDIAL